MAANVGVAGGAARVATSMGANVDAGIAVGAVLPPQANTTRPRIELIAIVGILAILQCHYRWG